MHEYAVTESILEIVQAEAAKAGANRITEIKIVIGELSTFVDQSIDFYFKALARGTAAAEAKLIFEKVAAQAKCKNCGAQFHPPDAFFTCPECNWPALELLRGQEFFVESIEIEQ